MRVVSMLDDYRAICAAARRDGQFAAYQAYTARYPVLFGAVQRYLYQCPLEAMRGYVEAADLPGLLRQGEENLRGGVFARIRDTVSLCAARLGIDFPFDLYLGMELGNIGGASLPTEDGSHFLYIGMDRPVDPAFPQILVPHELHHLLRIRRTGERDSTTLRARMVTEGLASYCPLWLNSLPWDADSVAQSLSVTGKQARYMLEHAAQLARALWDEGDIPLDQAVMARFFSAADQGGDVRVPGYFVGLWLTRALVERGHDFMDLTSAPTAEILAMMRKIL